MCTKIFICMSVIILLFATCSRQSSRLEQALIFAGENRAELEKVLAHYATDRADSLKYRAACFLIENMPRHYSFSGKAIDRFVTEVRNYASEHEYKVEEHNRHLTTHSFKEPFPSIAASGHQMVMDLHVMTSAYLIDNIEHSFMVWREYPWASTVSFEDFCEQILPYRISDEPLQDWRRLYHDYFKPKVDSLCSHTTDLLTVGRVVYDLINNNQRWIFDHSVISKYAGAETLFRTRVGNCQLMAHYAVYVFRSLGIPSGVDMILQNPDMMYNQHYWNYMKDCSGKTVPFELYQMPPEKDNRMNRKTGKIYRLFFELYPGSLLYKYGEKLLPPLNDRLIADVTSEYYPGTTLILETKQNKGSLLYLGVFNNSKWIPITCSDIQNGKGVFEHLEAGIIYQPLCEIDGKIRELGFPVALYPEKKSCILEPDTIHRQTMELGRKYPFPGWYITEKHRSAGGRFEVADDSLFTHPVTIHTHVDSLAFNYYHIETPSSPQARYVRYYPARDSHNNMAELTFISEGEKLRGKVIGYEKTGRYDGDHTRNAAFDNDPLTYCESAAPDGGWIGLELEKAVRITEIAYIFRNDDNSIREGDVYELFYFADNGNVSLGKQTGRKNGLLVYKNAPSGALYLLRNLTRGKEERPFTYENREQVWW